MQTKLETLSQRPSPWQLCDKYNINIFNIIIKYDMI